jgi:hypothetical protein
VWGGFVAFFIHLTSNWPDVHGSILRERYGIKAGDTLNLVDLNGVFVPAPMAPMVPELARKIERLREEAGVSIEELLQGLREQRQQYLLARLN